MDKFCLIIDKFSFHFRSNTRYLKNFKYGYNVQSFLHRFYSKNETLFNYNTEFEINHKNAFL